MKKIASLFVLAAACLLIPGSLSASEGDKSSPETDGSAEKTAKPILIRHGFVYSAEISKQKPNFQVEVKGDQPPFPDPAWAAVMLKLPKNRGISRFDYELKTHSGSYPCLAVALGDEPFSQKREQWTIEAKKEQEGKFVRMLFAFPVTDLTQSAMQDMELVFKMRDSACQPPPIPFRILPDGQPLNADPQLLGENGNCGLSWLELHPEQVPSLENNPSGESEKKEEGKTEEKAGVKAGEKKAAAEKAPAKASANPEKKASEEKKAAEKAPEKASANPEKKVSEEKKAAAEKVPEKASAKAEKKAAAEEEPSEKPAGKTGKKAGGKASKKKAD